jgi:type IV secretion system protein VirB10
MVADKPENNPENNEYFDKDHAQDDNFDHEYVEEESPEVSKGLSKVAVSKGSTIAVLVVMCSLSLYFIYQAFAPTEQEEAAKKQQEELASKPVVNPPQTSDDQDFMPKVPSLADVPQVMIPKNVPVPKPEPAPQPVEPSEPPRMSQGSIPVPVINSDNNQLTDQQISARKKSSMSVIGGGGGGGSASNLIDSATETYNSVPITGNQVTATRIGDMSRVIAEGKMIDAILESAINTDLPGLVRGIVSHDVYAENGITSLIPKGSRIIGSYDSAVAIGQQRVKINWSRLIRPDGIDIALNSLSTDPLGAAGTQGEVDNHYMQMFSGTLMLSLLNISVSGWMDVLNKKSGYKPPSQSIEGGVGPNNSNATNSGQYQYKVTNEVEGNRPLQRKARMKALDDFNDDAKNIINNQIKNLKPTITIPQGTKIKVFVTRDLVFPKLQNNGGMEIIQ